MAKFYVTCGSQSLTINAESADFAAMRLIDEVMATHVWVYNDSQLSEQDRRDHLMIEALLHLGSAVCVSEIGLGRSESGTFGVPEMLGEWHQLMTGLSRMIVAAGLAPRNVLPEPSSDNQNNRISR